MRVVVTGGAGFIGSHLVRALLARGDEVIAFDNLRRGSRRAVATGAQFLEGDVRDSKAVAAALSGAELVYHLAAQSNVMGAMSDIDYSFESNVVGTFNVLKAATHAGVRRVVFASSREVYGEPATLPVAEDAPLLAKNPYGASKLAGEAYCRAWAAFGQLDVSVLRFANVYGPGDTGRVIPLWATLARDGHPITLYGGAQQLDFVPVRVAVDCLVAAASAAPGGPVNVGSGKATRLAHLAETILEFTGRRSTLDLQAPRDAEVVRFVADVRRMRDVLGVDAPEDPLVDLEDLLAASEASSAPD